MEKLKDFLSEFHDDMPLVFGFGLLYLVCLDFLVLLEFVGGK